MQEIEGEKQEAMAQQAEMEAIRATQALMKSPALDPTKNQQLAATIQAAQQGQQQPPQQ